MTTLRQGGSAERGYFAKELNVGSQLKSIQTHRTLHPHQEEIGAANMRSPNGTVFSGSCRTKPSLKLCPGASDNFRKSAEVARIKRCSGLDLKAHDGRAFILHNNVQLMLIFVLLRHHVVWAHHFIVFVFQDVTMPHVAAGIAFEPRDDACNHPRTGPSTCTWCGFRSRAVRQRVGMCLHLAQTRPLARILAGIT